MTKHPFPMIPEDLTFISVTDRNALYLGQKDGWNGHKLFSYVRKDERNLDKGLFLNFRYFDSKKLCEWHRFSSIDFGKIVEAICDQNAIWTIYGERNKDGNVTKHFLLENEEDALFLKLKFG